MANDYLSRREQKALKGSFADLVDEVGGGTRCAKITGRDRRQAYSEFANSKHMDRWPNLREVAELEAAVDDPIVARHLAEVQGYQLIKAPDCTDVGQGAAAIADLSVEFADLVKEMSDCLKDDGKITGAEISEKGLVSKAARLAAIATTLKLRWEKRVEGE